MNVNNVIKQVLTAGIAFSLMVSACSANTANPGAKPELAKQAQVFQTGWAAMQNGNLDKAFSIWSTLSQQQTVAPELTRALENNLAVILIKQKQYAKAEKRLGAALQADDQVSITLDNLNQIYSYQAQQAYQQIFTKAALVRPKGEFLYFDIAKITPPTKGVIQHEPVVLPILDTPAKNDTKAIKLVKDRLEAWRAAWAKQDVKSYLSYYSQSEFIPKKGQSYNTWKKGRYRSLQNPKFIKIQFKQVEVVPLNKRFMRTRFLQKYHSDRFKDNVYKVVLWQLIKGQWFIVQEVVVNAKD